MPGPAVAAIAGGIGSSLIGARSARKASEAQGQAAEAQMRLQADMFNRVDDVQKNMYLRQARDIQNQFDGSQDDARWAMRNSLRNINSLAPFQGQARDLGVRQVQDITRTGSRNVGILENARDASLGQTQGAQNAILRDATGTQRGNVADITRTQQDGTQDITRTQRGNVGIIRDAAGRVINDATRTQRGNVGIISEARDRSIEGFRPYQETGTNALAAYASELGLGARPDGFQGLSLTPGANFLMEQGRRTIEGGAAGSGGLYSGATMADLEDYRQGLAATDRDNQMAQMLNLAGMGFDASGNIASLETGAAQDIAGQRNIGSGMRADARTWGAGNVADQRSAGAAARTALGTWGAGARSGERNTGAALRSGARQWGTDSGNALRQGYSGAIAGQRNVTSALRNDALSSDFTRRFGVASGLADARTAAGNAYAGNMMNLRQNFIGNMGTARTNRANLYGTAATNYANMGSNALANAGDARAAGAIGAGNAWMGGLNNALGIYGMMGGGNPFGGSSGGPQWTWQQHMRPVMS